MDDEPVVSKWELKLMKKFSRENNPIPPGKVIQSKKKYSRKRKYKERWIEEYYEDED